METRTSQPVPSAEPQGRVRAGDEDRGWLILATAALLGIVGLTLAISLGVTFPFDQPILSAARGLDGWPPFWQGVSQSANIPLIVIGVAFVAGLVIKRRYHEAILVVIILVAVTAGSEGVKQLTARVRPSGSGDGIPGVVYSYPSGHVLESMTILGVVAIRFWRTTRHDRLRVLLVVAVVIEVVLVGIARLALNEHFPTDLIGGFLGAVVALGAYGWVARPGGWAKP